MKLSAVVLIDGEHYPPVVVDALQQAADRFEFRAALFLGGTEKIRRDGLEDGAEKLYGLPVIFDDDWSRGLDTAIDRYRPQVVVDLSDEPVLGYVERFRLASKSLAREVGYVGPDFHFSPATSERLCAAPSLAIIGTGKRVGKTAICGYVARVLQAAVPAREGRPGIVVVAMGRGGPARARGHRWDQAAFESRGPACLEPAGASRGLGPLRGCRPQRSRHRRVPALRGWHGGTAVRDQRRRGGPVGEQPAAGVDRPGRERSGSAAGGERRPPAGGGGAAAGGRHRRLPGGLSAAHQRRGGVDDGRGTAGVAGEGPDGEGRGGEGTAGNAGAARRVPPAARRGRAGPKGGLSSRRRRRCRKRSCAGIWRSGGDAGSSCSPPTSPTAWHSGRTFRARRWAGSTRW